MKDSSEPMNTASKRSINLARRTNLIQEDRLLDINLCAATEGGIERAVTKPRDQQWIERNRGAMVSYDAFVEQKGLLL